MGWYPEILEVNLRPRTGTVGTTGQPGEDIVGGPNTSKFRIGASLLTSRIFHSDNLSHIYEDALLIYVG